MARKINVGCGGFPLPTPDWENYDLNVIKPEAGYAGRKVVIANAFEVSYKGADFVYAGHFIEHQTIQDAQRWIRLVREQAPGAVLAVTVPAFDRCNDPSVDHALLQDMVSAPVPGQPPGIAHQSWWRTRDLHRELAKAGYAHIEEWPNCPWLVAQVKWQVCLKAWG